MRTPIKTIILLGAFLLACSGLWGCSGTTGNPVATADVPDAHGTIDSTDSQRLLWGMWDIYFDPAEMNVIVEPIRNAQQHFNITDMITPPSCYNCLAIQVNSFDTVTRILDADVTLRNPTQLSGFDVRGILYTNIYGHELLNADDWTSLWDVAGGMEINPFRAFAKDQPNRKFANYAVHTENYLVYIPKPPAFFAITYAVDASWPGNCKEPYEITDFWHEPISYIPGSSGNIYIDVHDWQGDVNTVTLEAPEITGEDFTQFNYYYGDTWQLNLTNNQGALIGDYNLRVVVESANSGSLALYDFVAIIISEDLPDNPVDVTPPWLNFFPQDVCIDGDYAYIPGDLHGLHIYDITDPANPVWVRSVDTPGEACDVAVSGGYAYVADGSSGLQIIDIDPPEIAYIFHHVYTLQNAQSVALSGVYAYVDDGPDLQIIDIDPPGIAYIVNTVAGGGGDVAVSGGYAYAASSLYGLQIIDIDPPESAFIVNAVGSLGMLRGVAVSGGYAYVADNLGLRIIDINPPESAYLVSSVDTPGEVMGVAVSGGYAYVADRVDGLLIIDIDLPESAYIVKTVGTPGWPEGVAVTGEYAYMADTSGLQIIDIDPPESANIVNAVYTLGWARGVAVSGGYAYVADNASGLQILDIDPPESAYIVNAVVMPGPAFDVAESGGYAYVADSTGGLRIIKLW